MAALRDKARLTTAGLDLDSITDSRSFQQAVYWFDWLCYLHKPNPQYICRRNFPLQTPHREWPPVNLAKLLVTCKLMWSLAEPIRSKRGEQTSRISSIFLSSLFEGTGLDKHTENKRGFLTIERRGKLELSTSRGREKQT